MVISFIYGAMPKCMTTFNGAHSSVEFPVFVRIWHKVVSFHAGMCTFGSQILLPKVCEYFKSGHTFGSHTVTISVRLRFL
jgi:hypothetical protein